MKKINLIQTGGTIAMDLGKQQPELNPEKWIELLHTQIPELSAIAELHIDKVFFEDSSDINMTHWQQLIRHLQINYEVYDGFVILHGTDTMAYTASALSFALQNLSKPVVLTGSQVPMNNLRSDARRNLVNAVELATHTMYEVAICFNDYLFRGNRSTKMSIGDFDAFASPNHTPIAEIGLDIQFHVNYGKPAGKFWSCTDFSDRFYLLKLHPNLDPSLLVPLGNNELKVIIMEAFGSGNFPMKGKYNLLPFIENCRKSSVEIIITSQAPYDSVDLSLYESGKAALSLGAISAGDMTVEATITKTMHLLGKGVAGDDFKAQFEQNIAGERTD